MILFLPKFLLISFPVYAQVRDWQSTGCVVDGVPTLKCLEVVFSNLLFISSALIVLVLFIMFIIGAFYYLTSFGNPEKVKKAQGTLKYAIFGFILFVASYLILRTVDCLFLGCQGKLFNLQIGGS